MKGSVNAQLSFKKVSIGHCVRTHYRERCIARSKFFAKLSFKKAGEPLFEKGFPQGAARLSPCPKFVCRRFRSPQRAVWGAAPKPRRLLDTHRARERRAKTSGRFRAFRRRCIAHQKSFTLYNDPCHLPAPCGLAK